MKFRLNLGAALETVGLEVREGSGIPSVAVKCVDIGRNTSGEAASWTAPDAEARKLGSERD